jgi:two-component system sensor histidine kinase VicK
MSQIHNASDSTDFRSALTENIDQVVFAYQVEAQKFSYLNPAFEQVFQLTRQSINASQLLQMVHPEDLEYVQEVYEDLLKGEIKKRSEFRFILTDERERWLRVKPILLEEKGKQLLAGLAEDITDFRHYAETELKFSHKKNAIIQMLSHDLAGPLGTIQSLSSLVATRVKGYNDKDVNHVVDLITQTSKGGIRLIQDFVTQEFLESSETELITGRINIVKKLREVVEQYEATQQNSKITFELISSDPSIYIEVDEIKLIQVVTNLISNAIKFTHDDGHITVRVEDKEDTGTLLISVEDNGIGIPKKYHTSLFDKFTKARRPGLREEPSVGLGMSIIKTIIEWHKGKIWFESEENKGTIFFVEIPKNQS